MPSASSPLVARDLVKRYGDRVVLDGVDIVAAPGVPLGVVGENGAGKSTLLRILDGVEDPDSGSVSRPPDLALLAQEPAFPPAATVGDVLDEALAPLHRAAARLEALAGDLARPWAAEDYDATLTWAIRHGV
ncbi:MAG: macrolide transport system ATP-binding/permease protein, partial [Nocardioidaceae bacterium]|nr:macrolide transport system ATP-binding/permease protein [Nocardioidaceae bacterium]